MPRLNVVSPAAASGETKELYDQIEEKFGRVLNIFQGMGNSSAALKAYLSMSAALSAGQLSAEDREVIYLGVSQQNSCNYCLAAHTLVAKGVGMSDEEIVAIRRQTPAAGQHAALLEFVLRVIETKGFVDDEDLASIRAAGYSDGQIAEAIGYIALATYSNLFNHVFDTELDFPAAPEI